tara:strand:- start:35 stop:706 length:672 start_codon:yes stop_codon:yes gene_type:complete
MAITDIYGINPNTGLPYQTPRTISDQNEFLGQTFTAPQLSFFDKTKNFIQDFPGNISTGFDKSLDLGKAAFGGIASLVTGVPGIGLLLNTFRETPEQELLKDFYGQQFGLDDIGRVRSGIMAGYNPVSMFGPQGLTSAIDKRMATIRNTLSKKKSVALENRLKELQRIKDAEQKAREDKAREMRAQIEQQYRDSPGQFSGSDRQTERKQAGPGYDKLSEAGSF